MVLDLKIINKSFYQHGPGNEPFWLYEQLKIFKKLTDTIAIEYELFDLCSIFRCFVYNELGFKCFLLGS